LQHWWRNLTRFDTIIIGAGAAGMMCAAHAGGRVLVIDHARAPGEKIRISGGGRCNFTNLGTGPENFLSGNPHFAKSALSRYSQWDFIELVNRHNIPWHEKTLGQLFCDRSAKDIVAMLLSEMDQAGAELRLETSASDIRKTAQGFTLSLGPGGRVACQNLVIACGGKSIPKMGASGFGYQIARQFGLELTETRPALVPFTFGEDVMEGLKPLAGVAVDCAVGCGGATFEEAVLFTHRGLSGPAILQASSYWREKQPITLSLLPGTDLLAALKERRQFQGRVSVVNALAEHLPKRLAAYLCTRAGMSGPLADMNDRKLALFTDTLKNWTLHPTGTEGFRTAEVTLGGVDTAGLSSKTMASNIHPHLYFIGEVVDVTGWLGGYNFQWAWSSGWAAGRAIAATR